MLSNLQSQKLKQLNQLTPEQEQALALLLEQAHADIAELHLETSERSSVARNYDSGIQGLKDYLHYIGESIPSKRVLERWAKDMIAGQAPRYDDQGEPQFQKYSVSTVNARLSAVRKLLRAVADESYDLQLGSILERWAKVKPVKKEKKQDKTERDYGLRLTQKELQRLIDSIDTSNLKGLRDRALIAVMAGAGLRVSEAAALTMRDVFLTVNKKGQRAIKVRMGKGGKSRAVVIDNWSSWVLRAISPYTDALGINPMEHPDEHIFRGLKKLRNKKYLSLPGQLSARGAQRAVEAYETTYQGSPTQVNAHDLRRTYAKICKETGMSWEALRENLGHASVKTTEDYVGRDVDWSERVPQWTIEIK